MKTATSTEVVALRTAVLVWVVWVIRVPISIYLFLFIRLLSVSLLHLRIEIESDSGGVRRWHRDRPSDSHVGPDRQSRRNGADSPACALSGPDDAARLPAGGGHETTKPVLEDSKAGRVDAISSTRPPTGSVASGLV
jgi:hypothetical protein